MNRSVCVRLNGWRGFKSMVWLMEYDADHFAPNGARLARFRPLVAIRLLCPRELRCNVNRVRIIQQSVRDCASLVEIPLERSQLRDRPRMKRFLSARLGRR